MFRTPYVCLIYILSTKKYYLYNIYVLKVLIFIRWKAELYVYKQKLADNHFILADALDEKIIYCLFLI